MNIPAELHEIGLVARRADGTTIEAQELVDYLGSVRVAAGVIDGRRNGVAGLHTVRMALTDDALVLRSDGLPATLDWQGLVRSLVHRFDTVAVVDEGVVDGDGRHHDEQDIPDDVVDLLESLPDAVPATSVHVLRCDEDLDLDAELIASTVETPVERARVEGFVLVRDARLSFPVPMTSLALVSQLPAVSFRRAGESTEAVIRVRSGRQSVELTVSAPVEPSVPDDFGPALRDVLTGTVAVSWSGRRAPADALLQQLATAGSNGASFAHDVAVIVGVPTEAAAWLDHGVAPGPIDVVEPSTTRELVARGAREIGRSMRGELSRAELTKGPLGGLRRFLLDHPLVMTAWAVAELALAYLVATALEPWAVLRWSVAALVALDGLMSLGIAAMTRRRRVRA